MGLFSLIGQTAKIATRVAVMPVAIVEDAATLGGALTNDGSALVRQLSKLVDDIESLPDSIDK